MSYGVKAKLVRLLLLFALLLTPGIARAVPLPLQAAILVQSLNYDQTVKERGGRPVIVILPGTADTKQAEELATALRKLKADARIVTRSQISDSLKGASALYMFPGQNDKEVLALCVKLKVLSLSGEVKEVEEQRAAICVSVHEGKPQLVINLRRVSAEGHRLSSRLLKLARTIE
jgi:hypothetical protein